MTVDVTDPLDLDRLVELAEAATPETEGRWKYARCNFGNGPDPKYSYVEWGKPDDGYGTAALSVPMARFIAACSPSTVLALVRELREAREGHRLTDPEDRWRLVRMSTDLLGQFGTRTERGERITAEWGEPDADGIYEPAFTAHTVEP